MLKLPTIRLARVCHKIILNQEKRSLTCTFNINICNKKPIFDIVKSECNTSFRWGHQIRQYQYRTKDILTHSESRSEDSDSNCNGIKNRLMMAITAFTITLLLESFNSVSASESDVNQKKEQLLFSACKSNDSMTVGNLIKEGVNVNVQHTLGWTPLMVAAINGHLAVVKMLLEAGAKPNTTDGYSFAARMTKEHGLSSVQIQELRDKEFNESLEMRANFRGSTALHYAALADNQDIIDLLIEAGANPLITNTLGYKPAQFSSQKMKPKFKDWEKRAVIRSQEIEAEMRRKYPLEQRLKDNLVGQEGAINTVASAVRRKENGWFDENHPLVMLFLGSSGIGKTELAKQLALYLHGEIKDAFIRIDMSEYQSKHEAAKFIGSPPGYVGHEEGGQLTERLAKHPKAVVLFDEVDKAHPDVLTTLLQLFDEGHLTDGKGKRVDCKDALFIMTANVANEEISQHALDLRDAARNMTKNKRDASQPDTPEISREFKDKVIQPILKRHFKRDEFLGRINETVYFLPFTDNELIQLVRRQLIFWRDKAKAVHGMTLTWDESVLALLAQGYDIHYGARSLMYEVERQVISLLASAQEKLLIKKNDNLHLTLSENGTKIVVLKETAKGKRTPVSVVSHSRHL